MKLDTNILEGYISISPRGVGYIKLKDLKKEIEIDFNHLNTALNGDLVNFLIHPKIKNRSKITGEVISILKRKKAGFSGVIEKENNIFFLKTDDHKMYTDIIIPEKELNGAKINDRVFSVITNWKDKRKNPEGKIIEILGKKGENESEMKAISLEHGFLPKIPKEIEEEAKIIKTKGIEKKEYLKRTDFRKITTFTIDPEDAKDFDDAISFEEIKKDEEYKIGVHIADVSHYVKTDSKIDQEARERSTSVYLVDRTIPMLPEILSNDLCSLIPNKDRLVFSVIFRINKEAEVKEVYFTEGIIKSQKRFSYEEAEINIKNKNAFLHRELNILNNIAKKLTEKRIKEGALLFEKQEIKFILDKNKKPIKIIKKEDLDTHHLIEEFMLLANKKVAEVFSKNKKIPFVYRLHDSPNKEKNDGNLTYLKKY